MKIAYFFCDPYSKEDFNFSSRHINVFANGCPGFNELKEFRKDLRQGFNPEELNSKEIYCFILNNENHKDIMELCYNIIEDVPTFGDYGTGMENYEFHLFVKINEPSYYKPIITIVKNKPDKFRPFIWFIDVNNHNNRNIESLHPLLIKEHIDFLCIHSSNESYKSLIRPINVENGQIKGSHYHTFGNVKYLLNKTAYKKLFEAFYSKITIQHLLNIPESIFEEIFEKFEKKESSISPETTDKYFVNEKAASLERSLYLPLAYDFFVKSDRPNNESLCNENGAELISSGLKRHFSNGVGITEHTDIIHNWMGKEENSTFPSEDISNKCFNELSKLTERHTLVREEAKLLKIVVEKKESKERNIRNSIRSLLKNKEYCHNNTSFPLTENIAKQHISNVNLCISFIGAISDSAIQSNDQVQVNEVKSSFAEIKLDLDEKTKNAQDEYENFVNSYPEEEEKIKKDVDNLDLSISKTREDIENLVYELNYFTKPESTGLLNKLTVKAKSIFFSLALNLLYFLIFFQFYYYDVFSMTSALGAFIALALITIMYYYFYYRKHYKIKEKKKKLLLRLLLEKKNTFFSFIELANAKINKRFDCYIYENSIKLTDELISYLEEVADQLRAFRFLLLRKSLNLAKRLTKDEILADENSIDLLTNAQLIELFKREKDIPYCFSENNDSLPKLFFEFFSKRYHFYNLKGLHFDFDFDFDESIDQEIIEPTDADTHGKDNSIEYKKIETSVPFHLNNETNEPEIGITDIKQGKCGDCYFLAAIASIAHKQPHYLTNILKGKSDVFQVTFVNDNNQTIDIQINDKFWLDSNTLTPRYAGVSKLINNQDKTIHEIWVMLLEKAFAKLNGKSYQSIVGSNSPEYDFCFALTGKRAKYLSADDFVSQPENLLKMIKTHFQTNHLPIEFYSRSKPQDSTVVANHAYALWEINDDNTFDIFNPWNNQVINDHGQHYRNKSIGFLLDNFDQILFFDFDRTFDTKQKIVHENFRLNELFAYLNHKSTNTNIYKKIDSLSVEDVLNNELELSEHIDKEKFYSLIKDKSTVLFRKNLFKPNNKTKKENLDYSTGFDLAKFFKGKRLSDNTDIIFLSEVKHHDNYGVYRLLLNLVEEDFIKIN